MLCKSDKPSDGDRMEEDLPFLTPIYEELPSTGAALGRPSSFTVSGIWGRAKKAWADGLLAAAGLNE